MRKTSQGLPHLQEERGRRRENLENHIRISCEKGQWEIWRSSRDGKNRFKLTDDRHDLANDMNPQFNVTSEERLQPLDIFRRLAGFSKQSQGRFER